MDRNASGVAVLLVLSAVLLGAAAALAQDWPQWRGLNRDGIVVGVQASHWSATPAWEVTVGVGDATPALIDDRVYVFTRQGDEEVILCLNAGDGAEIWRSAYAAPALSGPSARHPGTRSSPAVAEGKVVALGATGVLSCLDAETGAVAWRLETGPTPRFYTSSSPLIVDGLAIVQIGSEESGGVLAYDLASGEIRWQWMGEGPQHSSPVLMEVDGVRQVVAMTSASVVGLGLADGALLWQVPFVPQGRAYNAATPIVSGDTVIITGAGRGTRALRIVRQDEGFATEELWANPDLATQFNSPVLVDGLLFGFSAGGTLFCLDAATGETRWSDDTQLDRGGFGQIVSLGSAIALLPASGEMVLFAPSGDAYTELAKLKVSETPTFAHPVFSGNRLFVKGEETLALLLFPLD